MKKTIFIFLIISAGCFSASAQRVKKKQITVKTNTQAKQPQREKFDPARNSAEDLRAAIAKAQKESKRIILDIGGEWCGWCVKMDNYFLENKALAKFRDDNFIWVKVNFSPENENKEFLAKFPQVVGYPHLFVLETDGSLLHSQDTAQLEEPNLPILVGAARKTNDRGYDLVKFVEFLKLWSSQ